MKITVSFGIFIPLISSPLVYAKNIEILDTINEYGGKTEKHSFSFIDAGYRWGYTKGLVFHDSSGKKWKLSRKQIRKINKTNK